MERHRRSATVTTETTTDVSKFNLATAVLALALFSYAQYQGWNLSTMSPARRQLGGSSRVYHKSIRCSVVCSCWGALMLAWPAVALEKVSVQLKWKHQFQFAGLRWQSRRAISARPGSR